MTSCIQKTTAVNNHWGKLFLFFFLDILLVAEITYTMLGNSMGMFQDNGISPGLSCLNQKSPLYSPKTEKTGNLDNFLTDFRKKYIRKFKQYASVSLSVRLQVVVAKQDVRSKMTKWKQNWMQKEFFYFHQSSSEIILNCCVQSIAEEFGLIEQEGTQKNHSIENLTQKVKSCKQVTILTESRTVMKEKIIFEVFLYAVKVM